jgi:aryl-alcohol dehydrogenase-like predicted oxidoreductase
MEYRKLGGSGLKVSEIGLGGDTFGKYVDEATAIAIIRYALDLGINFIDTADAYGNQGQSEEIIGKVVKGKRSEVIIATKFGLAMGEGPNQSGGSRHHILNAVDASLKRLSTDYIDLYQIHYPDPMTPIEETLYALDDLVHAGKVRYIGCSNFAAWQLCEALWTSRVHNLQPFVTVQPRYNLIERHIEQELLPCCQAYNIGVIPWYPLAAGFLTGKYRRGEAPPADTRLGKNQRTSSQMLSDANFDKLDRLQDFASQRGHTIAELAISWLLSHPWVSTVIAGATKVEQVSANAAAARWKLDAGEIAQLEKIA